MCNNGSFVCFELHVHFVHFLFVPFFPFTSRRSFLLLPLNGSFRLNHFLLGTLLRGIRCSSSRSGHVCLPLGMRSRLCRCLRLTGIRDALHCLYGGTPRRFHSLIMSMRCRGLLGSMATCGCLLARSSLTSGRQRAIHPVLFHKSCSRRGILGL